MKRSQGKHVVVVAYDGLCTFEFGVAVEAFGLLRPEYEPWYRFSVTSCDPGPIRATGGFQIVPEYKGFAPFRTADMIIIPGWRGVDERPPEALLGALRAAANRGTRIVSLCSGVFVLAAAGVLKGRAATTHWKYAEKLQRDYPDIRVEPDILYTDDRNVFTSAGSAAAIDLCLHIIRKDFGAKVGNDIARRLVVQPHREGGQKQFVDMPMGDGESPWFAELLAWLRHNIAEPVSVEAMAERLNMSPRSFARKFVAAVGETPAKWVLSVRITAARNLLETTNLALEEVAGRCGFHDAAHLRHHFTRAVGRTPGAYRRTFGTLG